MNEKDAQAWALANNVEHVLLDIRDKSDVQESFNQVIGEILKKYDAEGDIVEDNSGRKELQSSDRRNSMPVLAKIEEVVHIARRISHKWKEIAFKTKKFEPYEIQNLNCCASDEKSKALQMLMQYIDRAGSRKELAHALSYSEEAVLASRLLSGFYVNGDEEPSHADSETMCSADLTLQCSAPTSGRKKQQLSDHFQDKEIVHISQRIASIWKEVALLTKKFEKHDIENIANSRIGEDVTKKALSMLCQYNERNGSRKVLGDALKDLNKFNLAKQVISGYFIDSADDSP